MSSSKNITATTEKSSLSRYLPIVVIVAIVGLVYKMGWLDFLSFESLIKNKETLTGFVSGNFITALLLYALLYMTVTALSLPAGTIVTLTGGFLFGGLFGGLATVIGATLGAIIIFKIAQSSFGDSLVSKAGPWVEKMRDGFKEDAMNYMLFLRLVPIFPFWLVNIAPALLSVRTSTYAIGTFFGIIPGTLAFSYVGAGMSSTIDAQAVTYNACIAKMGEASEKCGVSLNPGDFVNKNLIIAFVLLGLLAIIPIIIKKIKQRNTPVA